MHRVGQNRIYMVLANPKHVEKCNRHTWCEPEMNTHTSLICDPNCFTTCASENFTHICEVPRTSFIYTHFRFDDDDCVKAKKSTHTLFHFMPTPTCVWLIHTRLDTCVCVCVCVLQTPFTYAPPGFGDGGSHPHQAAQWWSFRLPSA